ncbi:MULTISPECIES: YhjD/YihY/BrkB family envelope integrity protein [unclassified Nocardioides]|uniref:YhjD/YihY/BrkB family envelope integrity protein n=1 Tax=unclassified Nocardioides TaxID=2615069 RepID=UPI0030142A53
MTGRVVAEVRGLVRGTGRVLSGRDLSAAAATVTYFAGIAVVPWLLLATWSMSWWYGAAGAEARLLELRVLVPPDMGGRPSYDLLVHAGTHLGPVGALVVLLPASFYGEGLRRAGLAISPAPDRFTGWRARVWVMLPVLVLPVLAWILFAVGDRLAPLAPEGGGGGTGDLLVRIVVGFVAVWLLLAVPTAWAFRFVLPGAMRWWVAVVGALATTSCLAGFLHGFQLFLSLPVDVGIPFGGLGVVGGVVAVGLWLYVLHVQVLVGWAVARALEERVG